ncbi:MAG: transposase [Roseofilum sp. SBFL]|nr:transposase [Roseofilum sp. SID3]MBP0023989.1 transposase [Roseofilum sp. SID2]MBP0039096.1 transposase [Roseofilum sp. SID1]MBP0044529.1 transposase [Roseofilum sp. SBFL]
MKKNGENHYGYKNHISIDKKYGIIRQYEVIDASVYDSKVLGKLIDIENADPEIWADSVYRSEEIEWTLSILGFESKIHEKGCRYRPLSEAQKLSHREKSRTRAKVEQVFGAWVMCMGGKLLRFLR